jgi:hypothetical protein
MLDTYGKGSGGTGQAIRIARSYNINVMIFNQKIS